MFLDVPFDETFRRMAVRDGCPPDPADPANARYLEGQRLYLGARPVGGGGRGRAVRSATSAPRRDRSQRRPDASRPSVGVLSSR